jgi:hypothetical protein
LNQLARGAAPLDGFDPPEEHYVGNNARYVDPSADQDYN